MKRSDMQGLIGVILVLGLEGLPIDKREKYKDQSLASIILSEMEEQGMLPPLNEQNYHHMDNQSRLDANQIKWYHSWEEEE